MKNDRISVHCYRAITFGALLALPMLLVQPGCASAERGPDLGRLYDTPAKSIGEDRTPVVVLPGILGSKLEDANTGQKIWGSFTYGAADADTPNGAREIALPMGEGIPLSQLVDDGTPVEVLDVLVADVGPIRNIKVGAYVDIMRTLAVGKYRDQSLGESGAIDYGKKHYTCFQYAYDWRRDVSESAAYLHHRITVAQDAVRAGRGLPADAPIKVDVVAHSMGGLVLRYYLRYGSHPLPADGSLPEITWEGAANVERAYLIGTPSAGSSESLVQLVDGLNLNPIFPNFRPSILGTMPAIYQLLPRTRHGRVVDAETGEPIDFMDVRVWERYKWGLADPDEDKVLAWLLPDAKTAEERRRIAVDHLNKCLKKADQLFRSLDVPATPPAGTKLHLFAGDAEPTPDLITVDTQGKLRITEMAPGDGTVTRTSAIMDERTGQEWSVGVKSPVDWRRVQFINADHLGLTRDPQFTDNLLYLMLEAPRPVRGGARSQLGAIR